ncbi:uncharacterized protein JCM6883_004864 [Sporobolomyces salmoneus]|uniref:uncharacterized protein n=1 Tax=Sporobolomyces salmoneus TaxID=183962 RepID=UPI0031817D15
MLVVGISKNHAEFCPSKPSAPDSKLAGRIWSQDALAYKYDDPKIEQFFLVVVDAAQKAVTNARLLNVEEKKLTTLKSKLEEAYDDIDEFLPIVLSYEAEIEECEKRIAELKNALHPPQLAAKKRKRNNSPPSSGNPAASLSKASSPLLTARKRLVYRDFL